MFKRLGIFIVVIILLAACATPQKASRRVVRKQHRLKGMPDAKLYEEVTQNYLDYNTINFKKIMVEVEQDGRVQQARASLRILKDSIIWLSVSKMGIEGMRAKLTPDSVIIVDRLHKEYLKTDYAYFQKRFKMELSYHLIQSLLTNRLPEYRMGDTTKFTKKYKGKKSATHYLFYTKNRYDRRYWRAREKQSGVLRSTLEILRITPDLMRLESIDIYDLQFWEGKVQNASMRLTYEDYIKFEEQYLFPEKIRVQLNKHRVGEKGKIAEPAQSLRILFSIQSMDVNPEKLRFPFSISSKYKQLNE